jgi:hypothetical protein
MDKTMSQPTRKEFLEKLRRRYQSAGLEHKSKLLDQAPEWLGYHRKAASQRACSGGRVSPSRVAKLVRPLEGKPLA